VLSGPFRGDEALERGLLTRNKLYGPRFRRLFPGIFVPSDLVVDLAVRSRAAYLLVSDRGGVLAGYSAALLLGANCAPPDAPAEVLVSSDARVHPGLTVHRDLLASGDVVLLNGHRVTTPARTAWDLARRPPLVEAVVAVDALARIGRFPVTELLARRNATPRARGSRAVVPVIELADPRAESSMETRLRVGLVRAGAPRPEVQFPVHDSHGATVARVDLAYPPARLAIEYDGANHFDRRRWARDQDRDSALAEVGWETMHLRRDDVLEMMAQTALRVNRLLAIRAPTVYGRVEVDTDRLDR
jgi:hypothetical protein